MHKVLSHEFREICKSSFFTEYLRATASAALTLLVLLIYLRSLFSFYTPWKHVRNP